MGFKSLLQSSAALSVISEYVKKKNQDSGGTSAKRVKVKKKPVASESKTKNVRVKKS
tara:strand:- start:11 stop:181 length:171 start_codon:yes stop_codon:yes gene_type:complete